MSVTPEFGHWLAGFTDGEGCFSVHKKVIRGHEVYDCQFSITLRADDYPALALIRRTLGFGSLVRRVPRAAKPQARYCVSAKADCQRLCDVFRAYPLRAKKARDFAVWARAVDAWVGHEYGRGWDDLGALRRELMRGRAYAEPLWT